MKPFVPMTREELTCFLDGEAGVKGMASTALAYLYRAEKAEAALLMERERLANIRERLTRMMNDAAYGALVPSERMMGWNKLAADLSDLLAAEPPAPTEKVNCYLLGSDSPDACCQIKSTGPIAEGEKKGANDGNDR